MRKTSMLAISVLTAVLLSGVFSALAAAEGIASASSPPYPSGVVPDQSPPSSAPLFPYDTNRDFLANQTATDSTPEVGGAPDNLVVPAPQTTVGTLDNALPFVIGAAVATAAALAAVGTIYYRRQAAKTEM